MGKKIETRFECHSLMNVPVSTLSDVLAILSLVVSFVGTGATILATLFAYQALKQFENCGKHYVKFKFPGTDARA